MPNNGDVQLLDQVIKLLNSEATSEKPIQIFRLIGYDRVLDYLIDNEKAVKDTLLFSHLIKEIVQYYDWESILKILIKAAECYAWRCIEQIIEARTSERGAIIYFIKQTIKHLDSAQMVMALNKATVEKAWGCAEAIIELASEKRLNLCYTHILLEACKDEMSGKIVKLILTPPYSLPLHFRNRLIELAIEHNNLLALQAIVKKPALPHVLIISYAYLHEIPNFISVFERIIANEDASSLSSILSHAAESQAWKCVLSITKHPKVSHVSCGPALLLACQFKDSNEVPEMLLKAGASLKENKNALKLAIDNDHLPAVKAIIAHDMLNQKSARLPYEEYLYQAIEAKKDINLINALLEANPDKQAICGPKKGNFLHAAVRANYAELIDILCDYGVSLKGTESNLARGLLNGGGFRGETPFELALRHRDINEEVYLALLKKMNQKELKGLDLVSKLIITEDPAHLKKCIKGKLPTNLKTDPRWLLFALKSGRADLDKLLPVLIQLGASCAAKSRNDQTAAEYAVEIGQVEALFAMVEEVNGQNPRANGFYNALITVVKSEAFSLEINQKAVRLFIDTCKLKPEEIFSFVVFTNKAEIITWFLNIYSVDLGYQPESGSGGIIASLIKQGKWNAVKAIITSEKVATHDSFHLGLLMAIKANVEIEIIVAFISKGARATPSHPVAHEIIRNQRYELIDILSEYYRTELSHPNDVDVTPLELACINKDWTFIELLAGELKTKWLNRLLCAALENEAPKYTIEVLLTQKNINLSLQSFPVWESPLDILARKGRLDVLSSFLSKKESSYWFRPQKASSPCFLAVKHQQWAWLDTVLTSNILAETNKKVAAEELRRLIFDAIERTAPYEIIEKIILAGAKLLPCSNLEQDTVLHSAVTHQRADLVLLLLDYQPALSGYGGAQGKTAINLTTDFYSFFAFDGDYEILFKPQINSLNNIQYKEKDALQKWQPLFKLLTTDAKLEEIQTALEKDGLCNIFPWLHILFRSAHPEKASVMQLLLEYQANPLKLHKGISLLEAAVKAQLWDCFLTLVQNEVIQKKYSYEYVLSLAIATGVPENIMERLIATGQDCWRNEANYTLVHMALGYLADGPILSAIVSLYPKAYLTKNKAEKTAFEIAAAHKNWECVKEMIAALPDEQISIFKDEIRPTLISIAKNQQGTGAAAFLAECPAKNSPPGNFFTRVVDIPRLQAIKQEQEDVFNENGMFPL